MDCGQVRGTCRFLHLVGASGQRQLSAPAQVFVAALPGDALCAPSGDAAFGDALRDERVDRLQRDRRGDWPRGGDVEADQ